MGGEAEEFFLIYYDITWLSAPNRGSLGAASKLKEGVNLLCDIVRKSPELQSWFDGSFI